jgi:hypothetical protein
VTEVGAAVEHTDGRALAAVPGLPGLHEVVGLGVEDPELGQLLLPSVAASTLFPHDAVGTRVKSRADFPFWSHPRHDLGARGATLHEDQLICCRVVNER